MCFIKDVVQHVQAAFPGLWIETQEESQFVDELRDAVRPMGDWRVLEWDLVRGVVIPPSPGSEGRVVAEPFAGDPTAPLLFWTKIPHEGPKPAMTILVLHGYHAFTADPTVKRVLINFLAEAKAVGRCIMITSPIVQIPVELDRVLVPFSHPLPTRDQLRAIAVDIAEPDEYPQTPEDEAKLIDAANGLTRQEAENAFALSLIEHERLQADTIWELKVKTLKKTGLLDLHRGKGGFKDLGGLDGMKQTCLAMIQSDDDHPDAQPKGVLVVGAPGCGKSAFAKALGNEVGWPTIMFDFGAVKSKYVGESEAQLRRALAVVDQMAPCILYADEIEKMLSGVGSQNPGDSGVSDAMFGVFLSWLNDRTSKVFHVFTANDVRRLSTTNAEFIRAGRFDRVFFVDLPSPDERRVIWRMYVDRYGLPARATIPDDENWTGAEIEACCKSARRMYLKSHGAGCLAKAAEGIVPVAISSKETLDARRQWAEGRYIDANTGERYSMTKAARRRGEESSVAAGKRKIVRA